MASTKNSPRYFRQLQHLENQFCHSLQQWKVIVSSFDNPSGNGLRRYGSYGAFMLITIIWMALVVYKDNL